MFTFLIAIWMVIMINKWTIIVSYPRYNLMVIGDFIKVIEDFIKLDISEMTFLFLKYEISLVINSDS